MVRLMFKRKTAVATLVEILLVVGITSAACATSLSDSDMVNFLTQSLCLDASGKPTKQIPLIDNCTSMRPQRADDTAVYQKRDWPDQQVYPHYFLTGHQASDSVLINTSRVPTIEQTEDFGGDPQHQFGRFDSNDAGQVVLVIGGWASIVMTEDANGGVQWFIGSGCKRSVQEGKLSWLLFNRAVTTGKWTDIVAKLKITRAPSACPQKFNPAFTRYRREQISFPVRLIKGNAVTLTTRPLDVIVVEHFGGTAANPNSMASLERFFFASHLGWIRWERWENVAVHSEPMFSDRAQKLVASARCPAIDYSAAPGPNWLGVGCRTWSTIVRLNDSWSVRDYRWRALEGFDWSSGF